MLNQKNDLKNYNKSNRIFMHKGVLHISDLIAILIILFPICNLIELEFTDYYDEIIGLLSLVYILNRCINRKLEKNDQIIILLLFLITCIGLLSNLINQVCINIYAISVDVLWLWKTFATFIAFKNVANNKNIGENVRYKLVPIAKFTIWLLLVVSILGEFFDIGVTRNIFIWRIKEFNFFWNNAIQTGWLIFCCILIISSVSNGKTFYRYLFIAMVPILLTGSALVYCWAFIEIVLLLFFRKDTTLKLWQIIFLAIGAFILVSSEFMEYFASGIRGTLWKYAIIIANRYFPFGAGFATYGSDMAQRYYSKLYIEFGWKDTWAYGTESLYLNDNFFASIIGQFGWIGFCLYLDCLYILFKNVNIIKLEKRTRVTALATVLTICAVMVGSASAKSMMGVCTFAVLGIIVAKKADKPKMSNSKEHLIN